MSVGGGTDKEGNEILKPTFLSHAELIDGLCQRYGVLPSQILREDAYLLKILHAVSLGDKTKDK